MPRLPHLRAAAPVSEAELVEGKGDAQLAASRTHRSLASMRGSTRRQPPHSSVTRLPVLPPTQHHVGPSPPASRGLAGSLNATGLGGAYPTLLDAAYSEVHGSGDASALAPAPPVTPQPKAAATIPARPVAMPSGYSEQPDVPLPLSRIPAAFHVRDASGRLIFPSERPEGDADVGRLAETLGGMLEEWRGRLEENKPSFPLGAARWGVLQMCIYDMCARRKWSPRLLELLLSV